MSGTLAPIAVDLRNTDRQLVRGIQPCCPRLRRVRTLV